MSQGLDMNATLLAVACVSTVLECQDPKRTVADTFNRLVLYQWHRARRKQSCSHGLGPIFGVLWGKWGRSTNWTCKVR